MLLLTPDTEPIGPDARCKGAGRKGRCTCQSASCQARLVGKGSSTQSREGLAEHVKAEEVHGLQLTRLWLHISGLDMPFAAAKRGWPYILWDGGLTLKGAVRRIFRPASPRCLSNPSNIIQRTP